MRLLKALEAVPGLNYESAENVLDAARHGPTRRRTRQRSRSRRPEPRADSRSRGAGRTRSKADAERQKVREAAPLPEKDRVYRGESRPARTRVPSRRLGPGCDGEPGRAGTPACARTGQRRRRPLRREGAKRFHREDDQAAEWGSIMLGVVERRTEVARAKAIAKGDGRRRAAARSGDRRTQGATTLKQDIAELDRQIESPDRNVPRRRMRNTAGIAQARVSIGLRSAARRRSRSTSSSSRARSRWSIPASRWPSSSRRRWKKLLASELTGAGPAPARPGRLHGRAPRGRPQGEEVPARPRPAAGQIPRGGGGRGSRPRPSRARQRPARAPAPAAAPTKLLDSETADVLHVPRTIASSRAGAPATASCS